MTLHPGRRRSDAESAEFLLGRSFLRRSCLFFAARLRGVKPFFGNQRWISVHHGLLLIARYIFICLYTGYAENLSTAQYNFWRGGTAVFAFENRPGSRQRLFYTVGIWYGYGQRNRKMPFQFDSRIEDSGAYALLNVRTLIQKELPFCVIPRIRGGIV